ncbi:uncharacterized protein LOC129594538 isoform X2 [Paramacrobiotus metropolitanus]|uniref:uncharacterized protein LOC129594538 isoform X2 n=1 Tax=Paramacrobiotus metropolitanus TaxID=2943436 RepID=UPI002445BA2D|nr:uncharacterized protein LOC129594538 isoform X2 [Paramacrobiotus metropolitanus]
MPEPPHKKARSAPLGSAIIFFHESQGCPSMVKALPLNALEPVEAGTALTEKTVCRARYRDGLYNCIVIWIEEEKTANELAAARLFPSSNEKTYEDKGYRWAVELGLMRAKHGDAETAHNETKEMWFAESVVEPRSASWDSASEAREGSPSTVDLVSSAPFLNGGSVSMAPGASRYRENMLAYQNGTVLKSARGKRSAPEGEGYALEGTPPFSSSTSLSSPMGMDPVPPSEILDAVLTQSTWKKALKLTMKKLFTTDELINSVPTERGARMSKNGKKALDQDRLNVVKSVVDSYCEFKDVPNPPTKEMIHQELGGILFSIRESHKKHSGVKPKKVTGSVSHTATNEEKPREVKGHIGKRKNGVPARAINYKAPSFVAPLDLSDGRSPVSLSPS